MDVHRELTGRVEVMKYLRKNCCHCIECPAANFLVAFMWRRPLNNAVLATTTYRKPERVSNGTSTQVMAQMINKCRIKIVQKELYNVRDPPWIGDQKKRERKDRSNQNYICNLFNWFILKPTSSNCAEGKFIWINLYCFYLITFQTSSIRCPTH